MKILTSIEEIIDPRMIGKVQHNLSTIIFVALCGILSGCEDWKDISDYCRIKKDWLSQYIGSLIVCVESKKTLQRHAGCRR